MPQARIKAAMPVRDQLIEDLEPLLERRRPAQTAEVPIDLITSHGGCSRRIAAPIAMRPYS